MSDTNNRDLNYRSSLDRARRRRNRNRYQRYALIGGGVLIVLLLLIALVPAVVKPASSENAEEETETAAEAALSPEEQEEEERRQAAEEVINSYSNLGVVQVSGYLNIRETPDTGGTIIGTIMGGGGCEILDTTEDGSWHHISSGGFVGYVCSQDVLSGGGRQGGRPGKYQKDGGDHHGEPAGADGAGV